MTRYIPLALLILSAITVLTARAPAAEPQRLAISQYGVTWTFSAPIQAERYITGDWWVVGPVTLKSITPKPAPGRHGSVINPPAGRTQGYDDRISGFDASLRIKLPLLLKPGESLVTTASVPKIGVKTPDTVRRQYCRGPLRTAAVLTCVKSPPPADAFRPGYVGKWKKQFTRSQLKRDALPRLKAPNPKSVPGVKLYERYLQRIWLDHMRQWPNRKMHPLENMPDYGREITNIVSDVALLLCLEDPDKKRETLLLQFVQKGIDYYAATQSDNDLWIANGGHNSGRKYPILFAGLMLGDKEMLAVKATFQEDQQTYNGPRFKNADPKQALWTIAPGNPNARHEEADPKKWSTFGSGSNNGEKADAYRRLNGPTWVGQALAARLTKLEKAWSHEPFFNYVDRWIKEDDAPKKGFVREMWNTYRQKK
jgi:hypothetical protein